MTGKILRFLNSPDRIMLSSAVIPIVIESTIMYTNGRLTLVGCLVIGCFISAIICSLFNDSTYWLIALAWVIANVLPDKVSISIILPVMAAITLITRDSLIQGLVAVGICTMVASSSQLLTDSYHLSLGSFVTVGGTFLACSIIGMTWGKAKRTAERKRQAREDEWKHEQTETADRLHSAVVNDLVYIIFLSRQNCDRALDEHKAEEFRQIGQLAGKALKDARIIISSIRNPTPTTTPGGDRKDYSQCLRILMKDRDSFLGEAGFVGTSIISHGGIRKLDANTKDSIVSILEEIYVNIMKYADPEKGYCLTVSDNYEGLCIIVVDTPIHEGPLKSLSAGNGIQSCRRIAEALGGSVSVEKGEQWIMRIRLPHKREMSH